MANHPSAAKRNRQRVKRTDRNRRVRGSLRTAIKKARTALQGGDSAVAKQSVEQATSEVDRAVAKGVLHRNNASRTVARLHLALNKLGASK